MSLSQKTREIFQSNMNNDPFDDIECAQDKDWMDKELGRLAQIPYRDESEERIIQDTLRLYRKEGERS